VVTDDAPNPASALDAYIGGMQSWVDAVRSGGSVDDRIPVNVPPTAEYADLLDRRLKFLDEKILPDYSQDLSRPPA
jgi:hypothetical protein